MGIQTANKLLHLDSANPGMFICVIKYLCWSKEMGFCKLNDEDAGPKKTPEYSLIEFGNQVYTFFAGDDSRTN